MFANYLELRQLRKDVKQLDRDNSFERSRREEAESKQRKAEQTVREKDREIEKLNKRITKLEGDNKKQAEVIRDQTGADLLVNALRELGVVPKPEKAPDPYAEQVRLMEQMRAAAPPGYQGQAQHVGSGLSSLLGGAIR